MFIKCSNGKCRAYVCEDADPVADRILFNLIKWITDFAIPECCFYPYENQ
jgi:hypothetical protein